MSRIGKKPVKILDKVKVRCENNTVVVEGPKGKLSVVVNHPITVEVKDGEVLVKRASDDKKERALHGLYRSLINNAVIGVTSGYKKELLIDGVGYKAQLQGKKLVLDVGYSHQITYESPKEVVVTVPTPTQVVVDGIDKHMVGQVAAIIRAFCKPEPYKGKGIRYMNEHIRRKQGKKVG